MSAQHHRQREKKSKAQVAAKKGKAKGGASAADEDDDGEGEEERRREPIHNVQDLIDAVLKDIESDRMSLQPLKNAFKRLLQMHRSLKNAELEVEGIWKPFAHRKIRLEFQQLRSTEHEAYVQASSLLKLTSSASMETSVEGDADEVIKKREEVAGKLMACAPDGVLDLLDASLDYGRCQAMYDHVVDKVEKLLDQCETATNYLERLRKSLPVQQLRQLDLKEQEAVWAWCDVEEHVAPGVVCFSIGNPGHTSDEYQLRSPPFYALGVPWTLRLYKAKAGAGQEAAFMAAYLDAGNALRIDNSFEKEVTFTFALRKAAEQKSGVMCRKEATFTFNKAADNRGWKECVPASQVEDGPLYFTVEVREGAVATENITITVKLEGHSNCPNASFKVKPSTSMARLMESYCSKHHFRPDKVKLKYLDKKTGSAKAVETEQTPSDLGMSLEQEEVRHRL